MTSQEKSAGMSRRTFAGLAGAAGVSSGLIVGWLVGQQFPVGITKPTTHDSVQSGNTAENLGYAFAGESQANRRYVAFARKADDDGLVQVAKLFRAAAEAETIHAMNHLRIAGEIKSTLENLNAAVAGETFEFTKMYPAYLQISNKEGNSQATWSFDVANKVEQVHAGLFQKAVEAVKNNTDLAKADYYVCPVCGNTFEGEPPEYCPICGAPRSKFSKIS